MIAPQPAPKSPKGPRRAELKLMPTSSRSLLISLRFDETQRELFYIRGRPLIAVCVLLYPPTNIWSQIFGEMCLQFGRNIVAVCSRATVSQYPPGTSSQASGAQPVEFSASLNCVHTCTQRIRFVATIFFLSTRTHQGNVC